MEIGFLHIGMLKTASTYMQNIWLRDKAYCLSKRGNIEFVKQLEVAIKEDNLNKDLEVDISADQNYHQGQKLVISNEGLSTSYLNDIEFQHKIPSFIDYSSRIFGGLSDETQNLLIIVREPISWIKSLFNQSIKQGGSSSAQNFVQEQHRLLKHSLDLEFIVGCYQRYFNNILILPFEILKDDEDQFWNIISERFEVPFAKERIEKRANKSFDLQRTFMLSKLNEISGVLLRFLADSQEYKYSYSQEKDNLLKIYEHSSKWVPRRFFEFAGQKQLNKIYDLLNISDIPEDFMDFNLSNELIEVIESKYIDILKDHIDQEYVDLYEKEFQNYISKQETILG